MLVIGDSKHSEIKAGQLVARELGVELHVCHLTPAPQTIDDLLRVAHPKIMRFLSQFL